jgi:hypothetical protein
MSRENVELVRRADATFNRRDLDGFLKLMDPGVGLRRMSVSWSRAPPRT